jgi:drug/metabolite transporter (DMT)-like permease
VVQPVALTVASVALAAVVLKDRPTLERTAGTAVILAGLAVIAGPGLLAGDAQTPIGDLMFATSGLMWAVFTVLQKRWGLAPLQVTAVVSVVSGVIYAPIISAWSGSSGLSPCLCRCSSPSFWCKACSRA